MYGERKTNWKCHICEPRSRSPNNLYQAVVFDEQNLQKQLRNDDDENNVNDRTKKFKESLSLSSVISILCSVQSDVTELKTDLKDIKSTMEKVATNVNASNMQIKEEILSVLLTITNTLTTLVTQVSELNEKDKQRKNKSTQWKLE